MAQQQTKTTKVEEKKQEQVPTRLPVHGLWSAGRPITALIGYRRRRTPRSYPTANGQ